MKPAQATRWVTDTRFAPYLTEANGDYERALELYVWNARVSAAMFETLHHVEVILRNAIDAQFEPVVVSAAHTATWLCDSKILNDTSRRRVEETALRISRDGKQPTRGRVVAGLAFGFWRALFDKRYDQLWVSHLHRAFPGSSGNRSEVAELMSKLVPFRNRIAHHETIIRRPLVSHHVSRNRSDQTRTDSGADLYACARLRPSRLTIPTRAPSGASRAVRVLVVGLVWPRSIREISA